MRSPGDFNKNPWAFFIVRRRTSNKFTVWHTPLSPPGTLNGPYTSGALTANPARRHSSGNASAFTRCGSVRIPDAIRRQRLPHRLRNQPTIIALIQHIRRDHKIKSAPNPPDTPANPPRALPAPATHSAPHSAAQTPAPRDNNPPPSLQTPPPARSSPPARTRTQAPTAAAFFPSPD